MLFAGVTECVPELLALKDIDVAFMPMNIPPRRMTPAAAADCVKRLRPKVVYVQHYDNGAVAAITGAPASRRVADHADGGRQPAGVQERDGGLGRGGPAAGLVRGAASEA